MSSDIVVKNIASWKLNKSELAELDRRVKSGEEELTVKRELQEFKARASAERKAAAAAVAAKAQTQQARPKSGAKANAKAKAKAAACPDALELHGDGNDDACNKEYFSEVLCDWNKILTSFGKELAAESPLQIRAAGTAGESGVQDPFSQEKAEQAIACHSTYRCCISIFQLNVLTTPCPGVPLSRKRVEDLAEFYYGLSGDPRFHSDRMIEVAVSESEVATARPNNLQIISPEEVVHATLLGCVRAIEFLGFS